MVVRHAGSVIAAYRPEDDCTDAELNVAVPKSASGSVWQVVVLMQSEGASTIQSAEVTSIVAERSAW